MKNNQKSRRDFIKTGVAATAGLAIASQASSYANILGANDRVRVGLIGFADRARETLIPAFLKHASELNFDLIAVSDIWNTRRNDGADFIGAKTGKPVAKARNNDELYDMKDVDAVIVATADFQHALHGVEAVRAGRDAYVEKPMANKMEDARAILKAVEETKKIVQIGTQRRSGENYLRANDHIKSGRFGSVVMVEMTWNVNQPGRWRRPKLVETIRKEDTDWTRYRMTRTKDEWDPRKYLEFRLFWPYSSGIPCQWMVHQIDTVHWFTDLPRPRSVVANGGIYMWNDGRKNFDTMTAVFDYGPLNDMSKGFQVLYSSRMTNSSGETKEIYYSNGGTMNLDTGKVTSEGGLNQKYADAMGMKPFQLPEESLVEKATKVDTNASTGVDALTSAHMRNWMECVLTRKKPNADIRAGYNHSVALCMTIAALHSGKRATFDDAKQEVVTS